MISSRVRERLLPVFLLVAACDPYTSFGNAGSSLGPIDPVNFPPANLGTGGDRTRPGGGAFTETRAYAGGTEIGYFSYPSRAPTAALDPIRLREAGAPYPAVATPPAYVFDPGDASAFPAKYPCAAPAGWAFDQRLDDIRLDEQGNIFSALPRATYTPGVAVSSGYVPVVSMVTASSASTECQSAKSEVQMFDRLGVAPGMAAMASGRFLAFLIIEPAAAVYPRGKNASNHPGLGLQKWGWYGGYMLAYLDGGFVPTEEFPAMGTTKALTRMKTQRLYYPRSMVTVTSASGIVTMAAGALGAGYDVLTARRGDPAYSPVCAVYTYDAGMPLPPDQLPRDAATIEMTFNTMEAPLRPATNPYVYCLQVQQ
jgi:hypothetical protein